MKSRFLTYWVLSLVSLALVLSCEREPLEPVDPIGPAGPEVSATRTIHYRATVSEGVDTRATLNNSNQYIFQTGDRLFVSNSDSGKEGWLSGFLTLVSGAGERTAVFEGDLTLNTGTTQQETQQEDFYLENATLSATLISTSDRIHNSTTGALTGYPADEYATSFAEAVAQFSHFTASSLFSAQAFTLSQQSSFLINTLTFEQSVSQGTTVSVKLYNDYDNDNTRTTLNDFSIAVNASHQSVFVTAFPGGSTLSNAKLSAQIQNDSQEYLFSIKDETLAANTYYNIARSAIIVPETDLFAIQARQATTVTFNYTTGLEYSSDRLNWTSYTSGIPMAANDVLYFRATGNKYQNSNNSSPLFTVSENTNVYIYGDIMALMLDPTTHTKTTSLTKANAFDGTFKDATWIDIPSDKDLTLSATTLTNYCYRNMFSGCTNLTKAPVLSLSATTVSCCRGMFYGCEYLTSASNITLSATSLSEACYYSMFEGCTRLTSAPALPATTLAKSCYYAMFKTCSALQVAPSLPAGVSSGSLAESCYQSMFEGCSSITAAPELLATTLANNCYRNMMKSCTSLVTSSSSPIFLPAPTLSPGCYYGMFDGASLVNYVICLATDISAENCTSNWLRNVSASGTFWKVFSTGWTSGPSAIPTSWTAKDYGVPIFPEPPFDGEIDL